MKQSNKISKLLKNLGKRKTVIYDSHKIEIFWWGNEKIFYDNNLVAYELLNKTDTLRFEVIEENDNVQYEINFASKWHGFDYWVEIKRAGKIIYSEKPIKMSDKKFI